MCHAFCAVGWCHLGWFEAKNDGRHLQWSYPMELSITLIWTHPLRNEETLRVLYHAFILDCLLLRLVEKTQSRWRPTGNQLLPLHEQSKAYIENIREKQADWSYVLQVNCEVGGGKLYSWGPSYVSGWGPLSWHGGQISHALWWIIRYKVDRRPGIQGDFSLS